MTNIAVILAGGAGKRFGGDRPKQFLPLADGRSVLEHAVEAFRSCDCIDEVLVVMHPDWLDDPLLAPLKEQGVRFVPGGRERWESSWHAIEAITSATRNTSPTSSTSLTRPSPLLKEGAGEANILLHDAARPYVSARIIEDVCRALETHEAVTVAVPATDTMYRLAPAGDSPEGEGRVLAEIPDRATMMRAQTPQAFRLDLIRRAYEIAVKDPALQATDDCGIVHTYLPEVPIFIVPGEEANRKITFKEDI